MRTNGWEKRFNDVLEAKRKEPFAWGKNDCSLFAADCVKALTGIDFMKELRGLYASEEEAEAIIGYTGSLERTIENLLWPIHPVNICVTNAKRGDVVMVELGKKLAVGVWDGQDALVPTPKSECGFGKYPMRCVVRCWGIV